ncbi:MAG: hypothetical protein OHK93_000414 [Ramalina farinacea]|uniref:Uncharacterized protein n=1 Tax=Ramalina farinacea TaxID=258253 RepID=A0AA43QET7_9LECA|nr:hypothetical protein [Ramalina farinacea]
MSSTDDFRPDTDEDETSDFQLPSPHEADSSRSDSGEIRSGHPRDRLVVGYRSFKRRNDDESTIRSKSRVKRLKTLYNDEYRELYNQTIQQLDPKIESENLRHLTGSQIGISVWSAAEKARLFSSLARYGRHDVQNIATLVGSKSEPEIRVYLDLLHKGAVEREFRTIHPKNMFNVCDVQGSIEVPPSCESALESAADALSMLQNREDEKTAKKTNPKYWLLTPLTAKWVDRALKAGGEAEREVLEEVPAADLLDLKSLLKLSKRLLMNSCDSSRNWRSCENRRGAPSLMHTAFQDFHSLTLMFTKRVVQLAVTLAKSRIRAETNEQFTPSNQIRREDVLASLDILGVAADSRETWINMPRKCNFRVFDDSSHQKGQTRNILEYNEFEERLNADNSRGPYRSRTRSMSRGRSKERSASARASPSETSSADASSVETASQSSETDNAQGASSTSSGAHSGESSADSDQHSTASQDIESSSDLEGEEKITKQEQHELLQDEYMELLDQRASRAEETKLWAMLGEDAETKMMSLEEIALPKNPLPPSRTREDLGDWTDWLDYAAEWETMDGPVTDEEFKAQRRLWDAKKREKEARGVTRLGRQMRKDGQEDDEDDGGDDDGMDHDSSAREENPGSRDMADSSPSSESSEDEMSQED